MTDRGIELSIEAIRYIGTQWGFTHSNDNCEDTNMFWSRGFYELVALRLCQAGAVEPNCEQAKEMLKLTDSISMDEETELVDECFGEKPFYLLICHHCNHHHFIDTCWEPNDWINNCESCSRKMTNYSLSLEENGKSKPIKKRA